MFYPGRARDNTFPGQSLEVIGQAYIDSGEEYEFDGETYYRSHSPDSRIRKETGTGPTLYYGLCLYTYSQTSGYGIASPESGGRTGRSGDAKAFWHNCVKHGMAEEGYSQTASEEREYEVDADEYLGDVDCDFTGDEECEEVNRVRGEIKVEYTAGGAEEEVQYMPAEKVAEAGLILEWDGKATMEFEFPPADILAGLDLSDCHDPSLVEAIIKQVRKEGLEIDYIDNMLSKVPGEIYRIAVAQLRLPGFESNRRLRPNASIEREVKAVWKDYYGDLAKIDM